MYGSLFCIINCDKFMTSNDLERREKSTRGERSTRSDAGRFISVVQLDVAAASGESHLYRLFIATDYLSR